MKRTIYEQIAPRPISKLRPRQRHGRAFELCGRYQLDDPSWTLVHGSVRAKLLVADGRFELTRLTHAWLKRDGWVYDSVFNITYEEAVYVRLYAARELITYDAKAAARSSSTARHWGPWFELVASAQ